MPLSRREQFAQAIRDYPAYAGRPGWSYGLDNLDFQDFVLEFSDYLDAEVD